MSEPDSNNDEEPDRRDKKDGGSLIGKFIKGLGIVLGLLSAIIILIIGLVLGACFLGR